MIIRSKDIYAVPETIPETVAVRMKGEDHYGIARELLLSDLSTLFIGSPGMGKSTAIKKCIAELAKNKRGATVIFDLKGEYLEACFDPSTDVVLSMYDLSNIPKVNQVRWSLLKEAVLDSHPDQALKELAQMVFVDAIDHSDNKAFPTAAMLVFYSQMLHIFRSSNGKIPFTNQLIEKILSVSDAEIEQSVKKHTDLFGIQDLISRNTNITSFGIKMEMRTVLMEIFVKGSNFCTSDSRFSVRDFVRNGHGHKLFIEYSFNERESSASIIRLLLDLAMKEALSRPCVKKGDMTRTNFIFDEYAFLSSGLQYLDALKEIGRSKGCRLYGGFQNYNQLMKMHDGRADLAAEELAGFSNVVAFNLHDKETIENLVGRAGSEDCEITHIDALCNVLTEIQRVPIVSEDTLTSLGCGEVIVFPNTGIPFFFKLAK